MFETFDSAALRALIADADLSKPLFLLNIAPNGWVPCLVSSERHQVAEGHTLSLKPLITGYASQHYYQVDLALLVKAGYVKALDQSKPWQDQCPVSPQAVASGWLSWLKRVLPGSAARPRLGF